MMSNGAILCRISYAILNCSYPSYRITKVRYNRKEMLLKSIVFLDLFNSTHSFCVVFKCEAKIRHCRVTRVERPLTRHTVFVPIESKITTRKIQNSVFQV